MPFVRPWLRPSVPGAASENRFAGHDWSGSPLGAPECWPPALRDAMRICLDSSTPMGVRVPGRLEVYNDAAGVAFGLAAAQASDAASAEAALQSFEQRNGPVLDAVVAGGTSVAADQLLRLRREVPDQEAWFTIGCTTFADDGGATFGSLLTFAETTRAVLAERRLATLRGLLDDPADATPAVRARRVMDALALNPADHPLGCLFRVPPPWTDPPILLASFGEPVDLDRATALARECLATGFAQHDAADGSRLHAVPVPSLGAEQAGHVLLVAHHPARPWEPDLRAYLESLGPAAGAVLTRGAEPASEPSVVAATAIVGGFAAPALLESPATAAGDPSAVVVGTTSLLAEYDPPGASSGDPDAEAGPRLLLVVDDVRLGEFLAESLRPGYRTEVVADGSAAVSAMRELPPDVVLADLAVPGDEVALVAAIRAIAPELPVLLFTDVAGEESTPAGFGVGADDYVVKPFTMTDLRTRLMANLERARDRTRETAWRRAAMTAIQDGLIIVDGSGLVLETNTRFTDLIGYSLDAGPIRPPYPWWPTEQEDAEALADIRRAHQLARNGTDVSGEFRFFRPDRHPLWVSVASGKLGQLPSGEAVTVSTVRDITKEKDARERRLTAAQVSARFSSTDDFDTLLSVAEHGFAVLFDGISTTQISVGDWQLLITGGTEVTAESLPEPVRIGLAGKPSPDTVSLRPGILLVPRSSEAGFRAWIQFPRPRRIAADEMIVADLLAQAFALAVDRVLAAQQAADRESNLHRAIESHRLVGQAIGILIERHRMTANAALARLKTASQNRNLKLRELARRMIETGQDPERA